MINLNNLIGKRIAVKSVIHENKYAIYHKLVVANDDTGLAAVRDKSGNVHIFPISRLEDPEVVINDMSLVVEFK